MNNITSNGSKVNEKKVLKKLLSDMKHDCKLPIQEDILVKYIASGYFVDLRRKFRCWLMVSDTNPRSKMYLKSSCAIRKEKEQHLLEHYFMIHPFSKMIYCWEVLMILILFLGLLIIPILMAFVDRRIQIIVRLSLDIVFLIDMAITFNTGYQNTYTKKIIMDRYKVAVDYVTKWFALDLITCFDLDAITYIFGKKGDETSAAVRFSTICKLGRVVVIIRYLNKYRDNKQYSLYKFEMVKMVLIFLVLLVWTTSALFIVKKGTTYLMCFYEVTNLFFLISRSDDQRLSIICFEMVCLCTGVTLQLFFFAQLLQTVTKHNAATNKYHEIVQQLRDYMETKDLPRKMVQRVTQYFDFRFQKNYFKEEEILGTLSKKLIEEINVHSCESLIQNVNIFRSMPTSVVLKMTSVMKQEIFLPNDIIILANTHGDCMYFISSGTVAVYTPSGKEVCHLTDGSNFGEISLIMDHATRVATIVAVDYCDLFSLSRKDFRIAIEPYPDLLQRTMKIAKQRMKNVMLAEHSRNRPEEYFDFSTPEGIADFIVKMHEI